MLMLLLRSLVFALSTAGYMILLNKKFRVKIEFAPALYCAGCSSLLFFAGILNYMPEMTAVIAAGGLGCLIWGIKQKVRFPARDWLTVGIFGVVLMYFAYLLLGVQFTNIDNFTHWGMVVREMLLLDRMPNFADDLIWFQAYPLGSSLWIYYVCRLVGLGDTCFSFVQQIMQLSFLLPVFVWLTRKKWPLALLPLGYCLYALCANISVSDLLVDSMLPMAATALFCMAIYYRDEKEKAVYCGAPMLFFLLQLKNSGIFFVILYLVWIAVQWKTDMVSQKPLRTKFILWNVLVPFAGLSVWHKHVKLVFHNGDMSTHAMSGASFKSVFAEKSMQDVKSIFGHILKEATSVNNEVFWMMLILTAAIVAIMVVNIRRRDALKKWALLLSADWGIYFLYLLGLYATYLFSMSLHEAEKLISFTRYLQTGGIFVYGLTAIQIMRNAEIDKQSEKLVAVILCVLIAAGPFWNVFDGSLRYEEGRTSMTRRGDNSITTQTAVQRNIEEYGWIVENLSHVVYVDESLTREDATYLQYLLRYQFRSDKITLIGDFSDYQWDIHNIDAQYLYIWTPDEKSDAFLRENDLEEACGQQGQIINLMAFHQ